MTIIVFLIDTSASMNQRGYLGGRPTLLDVAKGAVETFVKVLAKKRYYEIPPVFRPAGSQSSHVFLMDIHLLCLSRLDIKRFTGMITGHAHLRKHLSRMGVFNGDPACRKCGQYEETADHLLFDCDELREVRQRSPESRGDRYMLMTFEEPPNNIKAGWKENLATFMNELKNLQCQGMTMMGAALKHAFDVLNINRMQTGIDTYGQGRCPFFLEPSVIVVITDGSKLSNTSGVQEEFNLPMHSPIPGSEMTREPFRWDQRLFSLVLRMSGTPAMDRDTGLVPSDSSPIDPMCEVTGGRSYSITSQRMLMQCIDSLVLKVQSGVVINFEKIGPDPAPVTSENSRDGIEDGEEQENHDWDKEIINPNHHSEMKVPANGNRNGGTGTHTPLGPGPNLNNTAWHNCRRLIYVPKSAQKGFAIGFWPIPESFWPDLSASSLPPRSAHPNVKFMCTSQEPMVIENLPFDKYELEPSPLTQYILARKQPTVCWQVFVPNSYRNSDVGHPFGYLKASTNLTCVNLFVMPYNYPALLPLLDDLFKVHRQKPTPEWRNQFANYLRTMPLYYAGPLRRALARMCSPQSNLPQTLVPDTMETSLSYSVLNYLKRLKNQAKIEYDRLCSEVSGKQPLPGSKGRDLAGSVNEGIRVVSRSPLKRDIISHPLLQDKFTSMKEQLNEFGGFVVGVVRNRQHQHRVGGQSLRNPFDIPRRNLIDQVVRMRANFLQPAFKHTKMLDEDYMHSMPVSQMGNYQEYLKRMPSPLREVESTPVRQHMFGNPFKIDKRMMVDEADIDLVSSGSPHRTGSKRGGAEPLSPRPSNKRKPGPIPRDVTVRRPVSPAPPASPPTPPPTPPAPTNLSLPPPLTLAVAINGDIDDLNSLGSEDSRARSPSPPPLQPYDECPAPSPNHLPPYAPPSLGPPPLTPSLLEDESPAMDWHPHHISPPHSPPGLNIIKPPSELALSKSELVEIRRHNLSIRSLAYKEVRRPGINYAPLFGHLEHLKGSVDVRAKVLTDVINESLRFKRRKLANLLDEFLQSMLTTGKGANGER